MLAAEQRISSIKVSPGLELVHASGLIEAFRPHRHDCYVVGITESGVQSFDYRGSQYHAMQGEAFVIHPDEQHDGRPGTDQGYGYHAAYIDPALISDALEVPNVPFVKEVVGSNPALVRVLTALFESSCTEDKDIAVSDFTADIADVFAAMSDDRKRRVRPIDRCLANRIRDTLKESAIVGITMADLEAEHGLNRFTITRHFHRCFGISPQRYLVQRRVAHARDMIERGYGLLDAAYASGFADQSHMTRYFVRTLGLTPGHWKRLTS